jgi:hypothetical protein
MTVVHTLIAHDEQQRPEADGWAEHEEFILHNVWFSDEAHFHLDSIVNKQNVRFRASGNPRGLTEKMQHASKITVWVSISSHGLMGPVFFDQAVNRDRHLSMLHVSSVLQLIATGLPLNTQWFVQDGATPHTANVANVFLDFLHDTFGPRVITQPASCSPLVWSALAIQ